MLFVSLWQGGFIFLIVTGPVQLSYSSAGVHPKQRSSQPSVRVPGEVKTIFACFDFWHFDFGVLKKKKSLL